MLSTTFDLCLFPLLILIFPTLPNAIFRVSSLSFPTPLCVLSHFTMCIFPLHNVPFPASLYDSLPGSPCDLSYFIIHLFPLHQMPFPTSTCVFYLLYHVPFPLQHVLISHFSRCHFPLSILLFCIAYLLPTALPIPNIEVNSILSGRSNYISPL